MLDYSEPVARLIDEFKRLPGIGGKSAQRLAFYILRRPTAEVATLVTGLHGLPCRGLDDPETGTPLVVPTARRRA